MIRATTPTFTLTIKSETLNLSEAENIYVSFAQGRGMYLEKTGSDIELTAPRTVAVWLSQEDSLSLNEKEPLEIQINWTYLDGNSNVRRAATKPKSVQVTKQLLKRVIA